MALQDIIQAIQQRTQKQIDEINRETDAKLDLLKKEWDKKIENKKEEIFKQVKQQINDKMQKVSFQLDSKVKSESLNIKKLLIGKVFNEVFDELQNLDSQKYTDLISKLLSNIPKIEAAEILTVKNRETETKNALKKNNLDIPLSSDNLNDIGGFVIKSADMDIDCSFKAIRNRLESDLTVRLNNILFE